MFGLPQKRKAKEIAVEKYDFTAITLNEKPSELKKAWKMQFNKKSKEFIKEQDFTTLSFAFINDNVYIGFNLSDADSCKITKNGSVSSAPYQNAIRKHFKLDNAEHSFMLTEDLIGADKEFQVLKMELIKDEVPEMDLNTKSQEVLEGRPVSFTEEGIDGLAW